MVETNWIAGENPNRENPTRSIRSEQIRETKHRLIGKRKTKSKAKLQKANRNRNRKMQNETQIKLRKPKENQAGTLEEEPNHFQFGWGKQIRLPAKAQITKTTRFE